MTEQELSRYYWLKKEVEELEEKIATFDVGISAVQPKEVDIQSSRQYSSIQEKYVELRDIWMDKRVKALEEYIKIEKYMYSIEDEELKLIIRYRFLNCMSWDDIGYKMGYDRTSVSKKLRNYLKVSHNSHDNVIK